MLATFFHPRARGGGSLGRAMETHRSGAPKNLENDTHTPMGYRSGPRFWRQHGCIWDYFGEDFGPFLDLDLGLSWAHFGRYLASNHLENGLLGALGPSKSRSKLSFLGSKSLQERSKRRPRAPHTPLEAFLGPTKLFSGLQEASKTSKRDLLGKFGSHVGTILEQFCYRFETMLPPCWSRFLAEGGFAKGPRSKAQGLAECA